MAAFGDANPTGCPQPIGNSLTKWAGFDILDQCVLYVLIKKDNLQKCENRQNLCQSPFCRKDFPKGNFKYIPVSQKRNNGQSQVGVTSIYHL